MRELPDTDLADILQVMTAEIYGRDVGREPVRHLADEHLPAMADRHQPGRPIQLRAVIVPITHTRFARMHAHPHLHHHALHWRLPLQRLLRRQRRLQRVTSSTERGVKPVTCGLHHIPGVRLDRAADDLVVSSQHVVHHVGMVQPQTRRTLHIREQKRDRPRRQLRHVEPSVGRQPELELDVVRVSKHDHRPDRRLGDRGVRDSSRRQLAFPTPRAPRDSRHQTRNGPSRYGTHRNRHPRGRDTGASPAAIPTPHRPAPGP